jgi:hypothetical protein
MESAGVAANAVTYTSLLNAYVGETRSSSGEYRSGR